MLERHEDEGGIPQISNDLIGISAERWGSSTQHNGRKFDLKDPKSVCGEDRVWCCSLNNIWVSYLPEKIELISTSFANGV